MFSGIGFWEVILIFVVFLMLFGAKRIPEVAQALGKGIKEFKKSVRDIQDDVNQDQDLINKPKS